MRTLVRYLLDAVVVVALSIAIIWSMNPDFYNQWAGFLSISAIAAMVMFNIFGHAAWAEGKAPPQPIKGLIMTGGSALAGVIVAPLTLLLFQHQLETPGIVSMMFVIMAVVAMTWLSVVFQGWPFTAFTKPGWASGLGTLILAYVLMYFIYPLFFDFRGFGLAAPAGLFPAWPAIVFSVTTLGVIFAMIPTGQMPLQLFARFGQPWSGLATAIAVLVISGVFMELATGVYHAGVVDFMVAGPIAFMFGIFMVNDVSRHQFCAQMAQPMRGICLVLASGLMAALMYWFYGHVADLIAPGMPSGAPRFIRQLWLANSMLSITFPVILIYMHFFNTWPIKARDSRPEATAPEKARLQGNQGL